MGRRIALDTGIFVYALEDKGRFGEISRELLSKISAGKMNASISVLVLHEVLSGVYKKGMADKVPDYIEAITSGGKIEVVDFTKVISLRSALFRARYGLKTPDAIHLASAYEAGVKIFITPDRRIGRIKELKIRILK